MSDQNVKNFKKRDSSGRPPADAGRPPAAGFAWHHIRGEVPADWEVTAYSVEDRVGRLEFNTRAGLQAVVSWEPCKREPDRRTTMTSFLANNIIGKQNAGKLRNADFRTEDCGAFLLGWLDESHPSQALAYDPSSAHIIRWVFEGLSTPRGRAETIRPILSSCDFNNDPAACEYRLHGVRCSLPRDYKIEDMVSLPANIMMSFESETTKRRAVFRRWGMAEMIFNGGDLLEFYKSVLRTRSIHITESKMCRVSGHEGRICVFDAPREFHSDRFMRRRWTNGAAVIWHDRPANRICTFEQIGPDNTPELDFTQTVMRDLDLTP